MCDKYDLNPIPFSASFTYFTRFITQTCKIELNKRLNTYEHNPSLLPNKTAGAKIADSIIQGI